MTIEFETPKLGRLAVMDSDVETITELCTDADLSKRGVDARINTTRKWVKSLNRNMDKYEAQGGLLPLLGMYTSIPLIELTSFWLNPSIAITDKYLLVRAGIQAISSLFNEKEEKI